MITPYHLRFSGFVATLACAAAFALALTPPAAAADNKANVAPAACGKYLVNTSGCHDCHTPFKTGANGPEPDMSRMLSGTPKVCRCPLCRPCRPGRGWWFRHAGPWGVSFTANLTPDTDTGLGQWSVNDFKQTIRTGRHMGRSRAVLPPMPIPVYNHFSDADLEAIYAYLRTIPALKNRVPEPWAPAAAATATAK